MVIDLFRLNRMNVTIKIESESKGPIISGTEYVNDNSDVWVVFENGEEYVATFLLMKI